MLWIWFETFEKEPDLDPTVKKNPAEKKQIRTKKMTKNGIQFFTKVLHIVYGFS